MPSRRSSLPRPVLWAALLFLLGVAGLPARAATFTVNTTADHTAGACDADCTLREAINAAKAVNPAAASTIAFGIPTSDAGFGGGVFTIRPLSPLPEILADGTTIDGTSEAAFLGSDPNPNGPDIVLNGALTGASNGLFIHFASNCTIQGLVINGWGISGVRILADVGMHNAVRGCYIGTNADGTAAVPNASDGVRILSAAAANTIGGTAPGDGNLISGNGGNGISILAAHDNLIQGNRIGTDRTGNGALANGGNGVLLQDDAAGNVIGGVVIGAANRIAFNPQDGVQVDQNATNPTRNAIVGNAVFSNGELGINLLPTGEAAGTVTPNDPGDFDIGPNNLQNFPVLTKAVVTGGDTVLSGTLNSRATTPFAIDFYRNPAADPSGHGEGEVYLGRVTTTTNAAGNATFSFTAPGSFGGQFITATATDPFGNTSEFSLARFVLVGLSIKDTSIVEGDSGTVNAIFTVHLATASPQTVTVDYATADGTATASADYTGTSGTLTFNPGQQDKTLSVPAAGDTLDENNETFKVTLSNPVNVSIVDGVGIGTIQDNDLTPRFFINDVTVAEGNSGTVDAVFTINLAAPSGRTVMLTYKTADVTATAGSDYVAHPSTTLSYLPGQTSKTVTVQVNGDSADEFNETFQVVLQSAINAAIPDTKGVCTISDDDPLPVVSISDAPALIEGDSGAKNALFTVTLTGPTQRIVTVDYATHDGTALTGSDYTAKSGTITFLPGQTSKTLPIAVLGDTLSEATETFKVNLTGATFVTAGDNQGIGTITDNDPLPSLSINDVTAAEGNSGTTSFTFTVTLSAISGQTVTMHYATANGLATAPSDYTATAGTLSFATGETSKTITVAVKGDLTVEPNETCFVNLSAPSGATLGDGQGVGTITNDDASE